MKLKIFISSVQKEFAEERRLLSDYIRRDPLLGSFFSVFLFEDSPAADVSAENLYLPEVESSDIYLGIIGGEYGNVDSEALNWAGYVERSGNGTESIVERCLAYSLKSPEFLPGSIDFRAIIWRESFSFQESSQSPARVQSGPKSVEERILSSLVTGELSSAELAIAIGQHSLSGKLKLRIKDMLSDGIIEYTIPDKPRSRLQKYRLTEKGRAVFNNNKQMC